MIAGFEQPDAGSIHARRRTSRRSPRTSVRSTRSSSPTRSSRSSTSRTTSPSGCATSAPPARGPPPRRRRRSSTCRWGRTPRASRTSCRAASSSGSRWPGRWSSSPRCCCSTSRWAPSTPSSASSCRSSSATLQREIGTTFVYVTHDQEEALTMSDRLAVMHQGHVMQVGTPSEVYSQPASSYVAGVPRLHEPVPRHGTEVRPDGLVCRSAPTTWRWGRASPPRPSATTSTVMVRPERVEVSPLEGEDRRARRTRRQPACPGGCSRWSSGARTRA